MSTRLALIGPALVSAVSAAGRSFDVIDGVVQCAEADVAEIAADLAPHGFVVTAIETTPEPVPEAITDLDAEPAAPTKKHRK